MFEFFDKLEDHIRNWLSRRPILYALFTGTGVILFWRGIWHTADMLVHSYAAYAPGIGINWDGMVWWDGPLSIVVGLIILLLCGVFVSSFIGNEIIISGLKREKKFSEKIESELEKIERIEKQKNL